MILLTKAFGLRTMLYGMRKWKYEDVPFKNGEFYLVGKIKFNVQATMY